MKYFLFLFLALFGFSSVTLADTHKPASAHEKQKPMEGMQHHGMEQRGMEQHGTMTAGLNLNDKQRELHRTAMKLKMESMRGNMDKNDELRELTLSDNYNEAKARELAHKHCAEMETKMVESSNAMNEFYKSLSAEQKAKMKEQHNTRSAKMKEQMHNQQQERKKEHKDMKDKKDKKDSE